MYWRAQENKVDHENVNDAWEGEALAGEEWEEAVATETDDTTLPLPPVIPAEIIVQHDPERSA